MVSLTIILLRNVYANKIHIIRHKIKCGLDIFYLRRSLRSIGGISAMIENEVKMGLHMHYGRNGFS